MFSNLVAAACRRRPGFLWALVFVALARVTLAADPAPAMAPTMWGSGGGIASANEPYYFQPATTNPGGLPLVFGIWNQPPWLTFDSATGTLQGTPGDQDVGLYTDILITVYDGHYAARLPLFSISVEPPPPTLLSGGSATLAWQPPTQNTDGSSLADLAGYRVYYGAVPYNLDHSITIANPGLTRFVVDDLASGAWYFSMTAYNTNGAESQLTEAISIVMR